MNDEDELSPDIVFDLLSNPRRRWVIEYLVTHGRKAELGELTDRLTAWENETTIDQISKEQRRRVYISLYQTHIPKLVDSGVVTFDGDTVEATDVADQFTVYLGMDETDDSRPWWIYYGTLAVIGFGLVIGVSVEIISIPLEPVMVLVMIAFVALAIVHFIAL